MTDGEREVQQEIERDARETEEGMALTIEDVVARVAEIAALAGAHDAAAHIAEDRLREDVLREIAAGNPDAARLASEALKTGDIEFSRWYE